MVLWPVVLVRRSRSFVCVLLVCPVSPVGQWLLLFSWGFDQIGLSSPVVLFLLNRFFPFCVCYDYTHQLFYTPQNLLGGVLVLVDVVFVVLGVFLSFFRITVFLRL